MKKGLFLPVLALLSITVASCGGGKQASAADIDSTANDSVTHADEAGATIPIKTPENSKRDAMIDAEATGVHPRQITPTEAKAKPISTPSEDNIDKDTLVPSNDHGVSPTYKSELMNRLRQLDNQANQLMAHVEAVRDRLKIIQEQGVQPNPDDQLDLRNTIDALIDIRNEQIALAKKLGNKQLEEDYTDKAAKLYDTKRHTLNN